LASTPKRAAGAVVAGWHGRHLKGLRLDELTVEEALERPAMTYVYARQARRPPGPPDRSGVSALAILGQPTPTG
jgi:hypothetical protein